MTGAMRAVPPRPQQPAGQSPSPPAPATATVASPQASPPRVQWLVLGIGAVLALLGTGALVLAILMR